MAREGLPITSPLLDCPLPSLLSFDRAVQVAAIWSDPKKSEEENFTEFLRTAELFRREVEKHCDVCAIPTDFSDGFLWENEPKSADDLPNPDKTDDSNGSNGSNGSNESNESGESSDSNESNESNGSSKSNKSKRTNQPKKAGAYGAGISDGFSDRKTKTETQKVGRNVPVQYILAVEGGELLGNKPERLERLYREGVRVFIPMWRGINRLGGAHDTDTGFTSFGREILSLCDTLGMAVDVSHMSDRAFFETAERFSRPLLASHSDSRAVLTASRNLTDKQFDRIAASGGVVGLNLYPPFVTDKEEDFFAALARHAVHFAARKGEKTLCLGADRDGIPHIDGYTPLDSVMKLYRALCDAGISEETVQAIFYDNAARFFRRFGEDVRKSKKIVKSLT